MVWYSHLFQNCPQFIVIHTVKGFGIVNKAEIDVFLELSCFFDDPADVGNLISGSSAFSKTSLSIWKFTVHLLLKPGTILYLSEVYNTVIQHLYTLWIDYHGKSSNLYCNIPYAVHYIPVTYLFYNWKFVPLKPFHLSC